ncbi:MAG: tRNA epoxyqueuosine(34) reductase QueG [Rhodocyclaceae bacterium]|nr:tRNA epoxyqueuosine(34) reductase QueG [Rhodocyclaceae bacterium]
MTHFRDCNGSAALTEKIRHWGRELGFQAAGICGTDLSSAEPGLAAWLSAGCHGGMDYMAKHGMVRARPGELLPGTLSVICARMDYVPDAADAAENLADGRRAYVSRYALGRDYHKLIRSRLQKLADRITQEIGPFPYRVFTDSAPLLEVEMASRSGLGWRGKHSLLISREAGSGFFLGEILCALPLTGAPIDASGENENRARFPRPPAPLPQGGEGSAVSRFATFSLMADPPVAEHCGSCRACLDACPTAAIVAPYRVDARRCVSYLTIEHAGAIPEELRPLLGNRIYGCDDCQLACPWNRFARLTTEPDFAPRHGLDTAGLVELFAWTEEEFRSRMAGSPILRIGHERWLRNIAVALGNAPSRPEIIQALHSRAGHPSEMVREHVGWALARHEG